MADEKTFCPFSRHEGKPSECMNDDCELWISQAKDEFSACAFRQVAKDLKRISFADALGQAESTKKRR